MQKSRRPVKAPAPLSERVLGFAAIALLVAALVLGGATREGHLAHGVLRLLSLPVLLLALWRISRLPLSRSATQGLILLAAAATVPLLQLIPLPPALWGALPGRSQFIETYRLAGMAPPWLPLSLNPEGTWNAGLSLLPPAALFVSTLALDGSARRRLMVAVLAVVLASVTLGVLQIRGDAARFYEITNPSSAVGFFANRNHQASLMLAAIPLTAQWMVRAERAERFRPLVYPVGLGLAAAFVAGIVMSGSRAGFILLVFALAAFVLILARVNLGRLSRWVWVAALAALAAATLVAFVAAMASRSTGLGGAGDDLRLKVAPMIARAGADFLPTGTGLGSFSAIYQMYEPAGLLFGAFLNHAHNDYLEIWLESGLVGSVIVLAFIVWFATASWRAWTRSGPGVQLMRAASAAAGLILVHSLVDYPLRTAAMGTLFAFLCGCLAPPAGPVERYFDLPLRQSRRAKPSA